MPAYPTIVFNTIDEWENYINTNVVTNGMELITGIIGNNSYNGAVKFARQSPLNWQKAIVYSLGGDIVVSDYFRGVVIISGTTPDSLTLNDNFYNEYVIINMTGNSVPLGTPPTVYYNFSAQAIDYIPANSALNIFKAANDLWVQGNNASGGGENTQKQPKTYIVGTTPNAPAAGTTIWNLGDFANSWIVLVISRSIFVDMTDTGDGSPYISKSLSSATLNINNYSWNTGDILSYILITP